MPRRLSLSKPFVLLVRDGHFENLNVQFLRWLRCHTEPVEVLSKPIDPSPRDGHFEDLNVLDRGG